MIKVKDNNYEDLEQALADIPTDNKEEIIIDVQGVIKGQLRIAKPHLRIRNATFINNYGGYEILDDGIKRGTFRSYTLFIDAEDVTLENVKVINDSGYDNGQAIALMIDGDRFKAQNCEISSYQDTLFLAPLPQEEYEKGGFRGPLENRERKMRKAVFENCLIEGSIDFIFGGGEGYFHNCEIRSRNIHRDINGYVCAPSTPKEQKYGFIFDGCDFTSEEGMENSVYLGRPWRDHGKCLIIDSRIGKHIVKEGYSDWDKERARSTSEFKETGNIDLGLKDRVVWMKEVNNQDIEYIDRLRKDESI